MGMVIGKKNIERFSGHETSLTPEEAKLKSSSLFKPSIADHLSNEKIQLQKTDYT